MSKRIRRGDAEKQVGKLALRPRRCLCGRPGVQLVIGEEEWRCVKCAINADWAAGMGGDE